MWPFDGTKYSSIILYFYDAWLMRVGNPFFWRCSTKDVLIPLQQRNTGIDHCDIGCGTGYYLVRNNYKPESTVTLVDIESSPLQPLPLPPTQSVTTRSQSKFDSISLIYLLHTLPVSPSQKVQVFKKLRTAIKPSGVVFGATILGRGPWHSAAGRVLLRVLNWEKRLTNYDDKPEIFVNALKESFGQVKADVVGSILIFEAREPKF